MPTESIFYICRACAAKMNKRDIKWHRCINHHSFDVGVAMKIITYSISNTCKSTLFAIFILEELLCHDMAIKIGRLIYNTRYDIPMWYRDCRKSDGWNENTIANTRRGNKQKNKKTRKKWTNKHFHDFDSVATN